MGDEGERDFWERGQAPQEAEDPTDENPGDADAVAATGRDWYDRYLPKEERRDALWLGSAYAAFVGSLSLIDVVDGWLTGALGSTLQHAAAGAALHALAVFAVVLVARRRFHAPAAIVGVLIAGGLLHVATTVFSALISMAEWAAVRAAVGDRGLIELSGSWEQLLWALPPLGAVAGAVAAAGVLAARHGASAARAVDPAEDEDGRLVRLETFPEETGFGRYSAPRARDLALWMVAVAAVGWLIRTVVLLPAGVASSFQIARSMSSSGGPPGSSALSFLSFPLGMLGTCLGYYVVLRRGAPRSVWMPYAVSTPVALISSVASVVGQSVASGSPDIPFVLATLVLPIGSLLPVILGVYLGVRWQEQHGVNEPPPEEAAVA